MEYGHVACNHQGMKTLLCVSLDQNPVTGKKICSRWRGDEKCLVVVLHKQQSFVPSRIDHRGFEDRVDSMSCLCIIERVDCMQRSKRCRFRRPCRAQKRENDRYDGSELSEERTPRLACTPQSCIPGTTDVGVRTRHRFGSHRKPSAPFSIAMRFDTRIGAMHHHHFEAYSAPTVKHRLANSDIRCLSSHRPET